MNQKITLDFGLRREYYPIMTRADRQIEISGDCMRILSLDGSYAERQVRLAIRYSF